MHPSNNLLLPILRKQGDRLLKAQIEAMVKDLSWKEQELFLQRQLDASIEEIREKLAKSYPDYPFLTEWQPEILRKSLKSWIFALSGEQNYTSGIENFTLVMALIELGTPLFVIGLTPKKNNEIQIDKYSKVKNGYRLREYPKARDIKRCSLPCRVTGDCLEDWLAYTTGLAKNSIEGFESTLLAKLLENFE